MPSTDGLKDLDDILEVDVRNLAFCHIDKDTGEIIRNSLAAHHETISSFYLEKHVPTEVVEQYDIARNLYLYSWFVYRFYNVSELQALTALELALRKRINIDAMIAWFKTNRPNWKNPRSLKGYLTYAHAMGWIIDEEFPLWKNRGYLKAKEQHEFAWMNRPSKNKNDQIIIPTFDSSKVDISEYEYDWDYGEHLIEHLPNIRNEYGHGSSTLHNMVLLTFENVAILINQIFRH